MRTSSGIILVLAMIVFTNGFLLQKFHVIPYITGFLMVNFIIGIVTIPKYSPTVFIGRMIVRKQSPLPIGAIQNKFASGPCLVLTSVILGSLYCCNRMFLISMLCAFCVLFALLCYFSKLYLEYALVAHYTL
jgi:hypothetical protein